MIQFDYTERTLLNNELVARKGRIRMFIRTGDQTTGNSFFNLAFQVLMCYSICACTGDPLGLISGGSLIV